MTISFQYKKKPSLIEAVKNDLSLEIIDHSSELLEKTEHTEEHVLYCACKYEDNITAIVSLITYNSFNKECFVKVMDESVNPYYYGRCYRRIVGICRCHISPSFHFQSIC